MLLLCFLLIGSNEATDLTTESPLLLTVSSLSREVVDNVLPIESEIQIHYDYPKLKEGGFESIALFSHDPLDQNNLHEPLYRVAVDELKKDGFLQTNVTLGNPEMPFGWSLNSKDPTVPGEHCLPFLAAGYKKEKIIKSECLKIRPTWMQDNRLFIENMDMRNMFLPGTHNSACYKQGHKLRLRDAIGRYILTQDQNVWNQLVYGIRYLDFRIGYYAPKENSSVKEDVGNRFWINHDLIKVRPLAPIVEEIKQFLSKARDEVVIIDFHRFPIGFNLREERHAAFVSYLERELKDLAIPFTTQSLTLNKIWETRKRLILSYGDSNIARGKSWLWPPVKQIWGNKGTAQDLQRFLSIVVSNSSSFQRPDKGLWAAMAHLTPGPLDLLINPKGSLRDLAHQVNPKMIGWCKQKDWWPNLRIVATDFFLESGIVNMAVAANVINGHKTKTYETT